MGSLSGISPAGGSSGTKLMERTREKQSITSEQRVTRKMAGVCKHLTHKKIVIDQMMTKVSTETSVGGMRESSGSSSCMPCLFSITAKKNGNPIIKLISNRLPLMVLILKLRSFHAFCQAIVILSPVFSVSSIRQK